MPDLLAGIEMKKRGSALIDALEAKNRVAIVDWKEHPLEVMTRLDRLAGKAWKKDAERWEFTESIDLDRCLPDKFLPACAGAFEPLGLALLSFDRDSDEAIFTVVSAREADDTVEALEKRGTKVVRIRPSVAQHAKPSASKRKNKEVQELANARNELRRKVDWLATTDGAVLRDFEVLYVVRLELAAGEVDEAKRLLDFAVTNELASLEEMWFRQHGPHFDYELLGAAFLVGRGPELVRGLAHVFSLGERSKTTLWRTFLGRDLPATWKRGATTDLDALLAAPRKKLSAAAKKYLTQSWSSSSRGMHGSRACLLVTGLAEWRGEATDFGEAFEKYVARALVPARKTPALTKPLRGLPKCPPVDAKLGVVRDASRPQKEISDTTRAFATWAQESITNATREKSGIYLRAVPETAVHVAVSAYAAGAPNEHVRAWLAFAVDLEIARCNGKYAEDALAFQENLREVAGAAVLLDRGPELAASWRTARTSGDERGRVVLDSLLAWLEGQKPKATASKPVRRVPKAIVEVLETRDGAAIERLVRIPTILPVKWPSAPWPGPFSAFVTALVKKLGDRADVPSAAKAATMLELIGRKIEPLPTLEWPKPRTKLPLDSVRGIALDAMRRIDVGAEPTRCAVDCLVVARCVHALGAPADDVAKWIHRSVDFAKLDRHLDADLVGAAKLVGRTKELASSIHAFNDDPKSAEHAFADALRAYASGKPRPAPGRVLKKRYFFFELVQAAHAAHAGDTKTMRAALARAPWQHRTEWTGSDHRERPPDVSWFVMALAAEAGLDAIPPSSRPLVDEELVHTLSR